MSIEMYEPNTNEELLLFEKWLSPERSAAYNPTNLTKAIALHNQAIIVSSRIMPITAIIEIALRNATTAALNEHFGITDWILNIPNNLSGTQYEQAWRSEMASQVVRAKRQAQRAAYAKLTNPDKMLLDTLAYPHGIPTGTDSFHRGKERQKYINIPNAQIIANLTLRFWKTLYSSQFENHLWKPKLKYLFPDTAIQRKLVAAWLEDIYIVRNRISHHERVIGPQLVNFIAASSNLAKSLENENRDENALLYKTIEPLLKELKHEFAKYKKIARS